jgi:dCMP deaminase
MDISEYYNDRPSFEDLFMETCKLWARRSTCQRLQTAAVIVKHNNIISIGYNGVPSNNAHCNDFWKEFYGCAKGTSIISNMMQEFYESIVRDLGFNIAVFAKENINTYDDFIKSECFGVLHHYWSDKNELHAELNAILQAEYSVAGSTLYTLYSPCRQCAKSIIAAKISKVVYHEQYKRDSEGLNLLQKNNVIVDKV